MAEMSAQAARLSLFDSFPQFTVNNLVVGTRAGRHCQTAVFPKLPFGLKSKRRADLCDQPRNINKAETGYFTKPFEVFMFTRLPQHRLPGLFSQFD